VLGPGPVLRVTRVTRDGAGAVLELLEVTASAARTRFLYEQLPIEGGAPP
jgi:hypothetical protein